MPTKETVATQHRPKKAQVRYPHARAPKRAPHRSPSSRALFLGAVAAALVMTGGLVAASQLRGGGGPGGPPATLAGAGETQRLLSGIPQSGTTLGKPDAPVTLVEFADLQCPYCGQWARDVLPVVVAHYVRAGKVRLVFRPLAFIGPESDTAARAALAAGTQQKLWNVLDLLYRNQGAENAGWVTDEFLRSAAAGIPGLDADRMLEERRSATVERQLDGARAAASAAAIDWTPTFELGPTGGALTQLQVDSLDADVFRTALDRALQ
jgi:protein-disulfide isomerase